MGAAPAGDGVAAVAGSLGDQGGAAALALSRSGRRVRALSHNVASPAAARLRRHGIEVVSDDLEDREVLKNHLEGASELFAALTPFDEGGLEAEERQVRNLADAAHACGVRRVVYSAVGDPDRDRDVSEDRLWGVERILQERGLPLALLRPAFFMENIDEFALRRSWSGVYELRMPLAPDTRLQWIAVDDVGRIVVEAFDEPGLFGRGPVELAADELSLEEAVRILQRELGVDVRFAPVALDDVRRQSEHAHGMYRWFQAYASYEADIDLVRALCPGIVTFEEWLAAGKLDIGKTARHDLAA